MKDYIRAGVELADGWRIADGKGLATAGTICCPLGTAFGVASLTREWKAALAAQLVRQVDAIEPPIHVNIHYRRTELINTKDGAVTNGRIADADRTMNTIKAIVDSKVLNSD